MGGKNIKEILKYLRQLNSFSQQEIANRLNISRQSYIKYEKGSVVPSDETITHLAQIYKVSEDFIKANRIPKPVEYKIQKESENDNKLQIAEPSIEYGTSPRKIFDGVYDGRTVEFLGSVEKYNIKKGQHFKLYIESKEEEKKRLEEEKRLKEEAWETIMSFTGTLPPDFDYKKELLEALDEKYGIVD